MKKHLFFLCTLTAVAVACNVEENGQSTGLRLVTFTASYDSSADTKTSYDDGGHFSWTANDKIAVYTDAEEFYTLTLSEGAGTNTGKFTGEVNGTPTDYAVYPYLGTLPKYENGILEVYLPTSYNWDFDSYTEANNPMVAKVNGDESISFKNLGALLKITLIQVDAGATKASFYSGKQLTGFFEVQDLGSDTPYITAEEDLEGDTVTFYFDELEEATDMIFYLPIPVGTYCLGFDIQDKDGNSLWAHEMDSSYAITIERNTLMIMADLDRATIR